MTLAPAAAPLPPPTWERATASVSRAAAAAAPAPWSRGSSSSGGSCRAASPAAASLAAPSTSNSSRQEGMSTRHQKQQPQQQESRKALMDDIQAAETKLLRLHPHPQPHHQQQQRIIYGLLRRCIANQDLALGARVHALAVSAGHQQDAFLGSHLIVLYCRSGALERAQAVLDAVPAPSRYMWAALILGHARHGRPSHAIALYRRMMMMMLSADTSAASHSAPDNHVFVAALTACAAAEDLAAGAQVHADIRRWCGTTAATEHGSSRRSQLVLGNALVDMYGKCGAPDAARAAFDAAPYKDVVTWTAMIGGYARAGRGRDALALYAAMLDNWSSSRVEPNEVTYVCVLQACGAARAEPAGRAVHAAVAARGLLAGDADAAVLGTALVDMYAKCGAVDAARRVLDGLPSGCRNVVTWNAMIAGYAQHGRARDALELFDSLIMPAADGVPAPNAGTLVAALQACAVAGDPDATAAVHSHARRLGMLVPSDQDDQDRVVLGTALVDAYGKCGRVAAARAVFDAMPAKNVVTWTAMIAGYAQHGSGDRALALYSDMLAAPAARLVGNPVTFVYLLQACGSLAALAAGARVHAHMRAALGDDVAARDVFLANALVDMYGKCGSMGDAQAAFDACPARVRDTVTWNALISGYARHGDAKSAIRLFHAMHDDHAPPATTTATVPPPAPDSLTFLAVLTACTHAGLVAAGERYFALMSHPHHGIPPGPEHHTALADLLGRSGAVPAAYAHAASVPSPDAALWRAVLAAAARHPSHLGVAHLAFARAVTLAPTDAAAYVLMANAFSRAGDPAAARAVHAARARAGASKPPGRSQWTDARGAVRTFRAGTGPDQARAQDGEEEGGGDWDRIWSKAQEVAEKVRRAGHVPRRLRREEDEDIREETELCGHSERLAIACALLYSPPGETVRVVKNLRVCEDCHDVIKLVSRVEGRVVVCRDAIRFHVFQDGACSCADYW